MATFQFLSSYYAEAMSQIELPIDDWDEVDDWYIKWDTLHYNLKSDPDNWQEVEFDSDTTDVVDWKRPTNVEVQSLDEDGDVIEVVDTDEN